MATKHAIIEPNDDGLTFGDYAVLWGVVDGHRTYFDKETEFGPATNQPILFNHGGDQTIRGSMLGQVTERRVDDVGLWVQGRLDKARQYYENVKKLIDAGVIGWSVGSVPGGYVEEPGGPKGVKRVASFLLAEMTLTDGPSQVRLAKDMLSRSIMDYLPPPPPDVAELHRQIAERECRLMEMALEHIA